jgi:catechol 1,2-dioxygenase
MATRMRYQLHHATNIYAGAAMHMPLDITNGTLEGTVSRIDGTPIAGAVVDTWHADGDGFYEADALHHTRSSLDQQT